MNSIETTRRYEVLHALRGIAAAFVALLHTYWTHSLWHFRLIRNSYLFVDLFFVLSGFVIANAYQDKLSTWKQCRRFLTRRWCRLYPVHLALHCIWLVLFFMYFATSGIQAALSVPGQRLELLLPFTMLHGIHFPSAVVLNGPSWSISVEFIAYTVFPLLLLGAATRAYKLLLFPTIALCSFSFLALKFGNLDLLFILGLFRCLAGFSLGVAVFNLSPSIEKLFQKGRSSCCVIGQAIALLCVPIALLIDPGRSLFDFVLPIVFACLIALLTARRTAITEAFGVKPLRFLGNISYSLYMVHFMVAVLGAKLLAKLSHGSEIVLGKEKFVMVTHLSGDCALAAYCFSVLVLAWFSYELFETRGRAWMERLLMPAPGMATTSEPIFVPDVIIGASSAPRSK